MSSQGFATNSVQPPVSGLERIASQLNAMVERAEILNGRLVGLFNTLYGPQQGKEGSSPTPISDSLDAKIGRLMNLIEHAHDKVGMIERGTN